MRQVRAALQRRLETSRALLRSLRALCSSHPRGLHTLLPNRAPQLLPLGSGVLRMPPHLSKLAFIALLEAHTAYCRTVSLRAAPLELRLHAKRGNTRR